VHEVALLEDQVSVELPPLDTLVGLALRETLGGETDMVADRLALPPAPVQVKVYVELELTAPVLPLPLVALLPLHAPEAVHEVALLEDHVSVELPPLDTLVGLALKETLGGVAATDTVAD
jgi:hypothetical protein